MQTAARAHLKQFSETHVLWTVAGTRALVTSKLGFERERRDILNLVCAAQICMLATCAIYFCYNRFKKQFIVIFGQKTVTF
jgi:hypothetical protein